MSPQTQAAPAVKSAVQWSPATRTAFRFCFVYFGLLCLTTQILGALLPIPKVDIPAMGDIWPTRQIVLWTAAHVFRIPKPPLYTETGSGDRVVDWILMFCVLVAALLATAIWTALDRRRINYAALNKWFRLFIRFSLGGQMIVYGIAKAVPLQMPFPYLNRLLEPYGNFSPMGVLWSSIGASTGYEIFAGCAELLGGILLLIPRTTMFGTVVCLADLTQVFALNMTYDVPVKLFSFHLILLDLFLMAPNLRRLADFILLRRTEPLTPEPRLFRGALFAQIAFAVLLLAGNIYGAWDSWRQYGPGRAKSELYGIWNVGEMSVDGQVKAPLMTDSGRWRRAIFDFPQFVSFERIDDTRTSFNAAIDAKNKTLTLTKGDDKNWKTILTYERPSKDCLTMHGAMDGHQVQMKLQLFDTNKFLLVSRGFHWVQDYPFNR